VTISIRAGTSEDLSVIETLLPRLADFEVPKNRNPNHLWEGDRELVREWAKGGRPEVEVIVAVEENQVVGVAVVSSRSEMLSGEPSAHLETLAVQVGKEGLGIGSRLMAEVDSSAKGMGAKSLTLHVFSANQRARALYERSGYSGELMRYYKTLD